MQRMGLASQRKKKTLAGLSLSDWLFDLSALQIGFFHSHPSFLRLDSRRIRYRFVMVDDKSPTSESESSQHQSLSLTHWHAFAIFETRARKKKLVYAFSSTVSREIFYRF
jgi:hypothetical protein